MISPAYMHVMARYNAWQNNQLFDVLDVMDEGEVATNRGAFFGSLSGTLSHILWGDQLWMSRFDTRSAAPASPGALKAGYWPTDPEWRVKRQRCDRRIEEWAGGLVQSDLDGDLKWYSGTQSKDFVQPLALCITHFFNHQTHHRGQVHAMLTAAGRSAPVTDLVFMPDDV